MPSSPVNLKPTAHFRPCIDLHDGKVKQIVGGTLSDSGKQLRTNFVAAEPPEYYAGLYRRDRLRGGHVIMLGAGNTEAAKAALRAYPGGLQVGGGITDRNAREFLDCGAAQVIVTSFIFSDGEFQKENLRKLTAMIDPAQLVLDLSCRYCEDGKYRIVSDRWQRFTKLEVCRSTLEMLAESSREYLVHAVDVEGKQAGIDRRLLEILAEHSPLQCVYAGGISTMEDIETIRQVGKGKIDYTVGSALDLFGGKLKYADLVRQEEAEIL